MKHRQTRIYQDALVLCSNAQQHIETLPRGFAYLADQLKRAVSSIALNFAEGYGKNSRKEQRRFFAMAKGSTNEVGAIMDIAFRLEMISENNHLRALEKCDYLARMLTRFRR